MCASFDPGPCSKCGRSNPDRRRVCEAIRVPFLQPPAFTPKACNMSAQGNALGNRHAESLRPEGAKPIRRSVPSERLDDRLVRELQSSQGSACPPRQLVRKSPRLWSSVTAPNAILGRSPQSNSRSANGCRMPVTLGGMQPKPHISSPESDVRAFRIDLSTGLRNDAERRSVLWKISPTLSPVFMSTCQLRLVHR